MAISVEFSLPPEEFVLAWTVKQVPGFRIEVERIVFDSIQRVTPYFFVTGDDFAAFEEALEGDMTVEDVVLLEERNGRRLYRTTWRENVRGLLLALSDVVATILSAVWEGEDWELRVLFADNESLSRFHDYCATYDVPLELERIWDPSRFLDPDRAGLTRKQREALVTAVEVGYFEIPRESSLADLAAEIGISDNAASSRLRRGCRRLIEETLM